MIRLFTFVMLSTLIVHGCGSDDGPALGASHVRVFAPLPGRAATVAYLEIKNFSARPITLNSVSSPAFARSELHETSIVDGVASMRPLSRMASISLVDMPP